MLSRFAVPRERLSIVLNSTEAKIVELADVEFSGRVGLSRGFAQPVHGLSGIVRGVIKQCAKRELRDRVTGCGFCASRSQRPLDAPIRLGLRARNGACENKQNGCGNEGTQPMHLGIIAARSGLLISSAQS